MPDTIHFAVHGQTYKAVYDDAAAEATRLLAGWEDGLGYEYVPAHTLRVEMNQDLNVSNGAGATVLRTYDAYVTVTIEEPHPLPQQEPGF